MFEVGPGPSVVGHYHLSLPKSDKFRCVVSKETNLRDNVLGKVINVAKEKGRAQYRALGAQM